MPEVRAAGGVVWRRGEDGGLEVAVIHRPKYDDWSLPKGKLDPGEIPVVGAVREVCEEIGASVEVGRALGQSRYRVLHDGRDVPKTVSWWAMRATGGEFVPSDEVDRLRWLAPEAAVRRLGRDAEPLHRFLLHPPGTSTVLLVRHGSAGQRGDGAPDDDTRPLDDLGRRQAEAVAAVLPHYAPVRVLSAPPTRCLQTVGPLAHRLGLPVVVEPALGERASAEDPAATLSALLALGGEPGTTVACSQGGAIPAAVEALCEQSGVDVDDVRARKGSVWALSFSEGVLVDADYTASLS